jgi:hypothetical protein
MGERRPSACQHKVCAPLRLYAPPFLSDIHPGVKGKLRVSIAFYATDSFHALQHRLAAGITVEVMALNINRGVAVTALEALAHERVEISFPGGLPHS